MPYCGNCERLLPADEASCTFCGRKLRDAKQNDPVLLLEADAFHANLISPLLDDEKILYSKVGKLGAGFTMRGGSILETYRFFVPYGVHEKALSLLESAFGEDPTIMAALAAVQASEA